MHVQLILNVDVDPKAWATGNKGQNVTPDIVALAVGELVNYSNAGYDGEMSCESWHGYEIDAKQSKIPLWNLRAYKRRYSRKTA